MLTKESREKNTELISFGNFQNIFQIYCMKLKTNCSYLGYLVAFLDIYL